MQLQRSQTISSAKLLNGNNAPAAEFECCCEKGAAKAAYLRAVAAARQGNVEAVNKNLEAAKACEKLAERASKDIEFAMYR